MDSKASKQQIWYFPCSWCLSGFFWLHDVCFWKISECCCYYGYCFKGFKYDKKKRYFFLINSRIMYNIVHICDMSHAFIHPYTNINHFFIHKLANAICIILILYVLLYTLLTTVINTKIKTSPNPVTF